MAAQLTLRRATGWLVAGLLVAGLLLAAPPQHAVASTSPAWPAVEPGGRPSLSALQGRLQAFSADWLGVVRLQRQTCEGARNQGKACAEPLFAAMAELQAVALGWQEVAQAISARLAVSAVAAETRDACSQRRDAAACAEVQRETEVLDAYAALRVAPALERLARLATAGWKELQFARAVQQASQAKMPQPVQAPPPAAPPPVAAVSDAKTALPPPPPPPPPQLTQACRAGKSKACLDAAAICEARRAFSDARGWYKLACRHGHRAACPKAK